MKQLSLFAVAAFALGCGGEVALPKGKGATGAAYGSSEAAIEVPSEILNAKPGSGMGGGGGDGMGRLRNPQAGGKAGHSRGEGKKKRGMAEGEEKPPASDVKSDDKQNATKLK